MNEIKNRLNRLSQRAEELETHPSELTKDNLLAEVRAFYDVVKSVETFATEPTVAQAAELSEPLADTTTEITMEATIEPEVEPEPETELILEPAAEKETPIKETEQSVPEPVLSPVATAPSEEPTLKKEPLIGKPELNTESSDRNILAGKLNHKPIEDLRAGIPLNEKFGIIRSLFKGNASDFGDAVLKLNNAANIEEMEHYLVLLGQRFGWDVESEAYRSFSVYVERKMMTLQPSNANSDK